MTTDLRTFYIQDEMCWWRCDQWTLPEARREAASWAREQFDFLGRSRFIGKVTARLTDHEEGCDGEHPEGTCYADREAWQFETYER